MMRALPERGQKDSDKTSVAKLSAPKRRGHPGRVDKEAYASLAAHERTLKVPFLVLRTRKWPVP